MEEDERRELKDWLTSLLPEGVSRQDIAREFGVERKTVSTMLNPDSASFGRGITMLRYLRLVGVLPETAPLRNPLGSRLESIEAKVDELPTQDDLQRSVDVLRAAIDALANPGTPEDRAAGGRNE